MAENKKSFLLYCDVIHTVAKLTDEQAGDVFKHILAYVNDLNPTPNNVITEIVFEPIKQQLKRDLTRWEGERSKRSEAGKKGMAERWKKDNNDMPTITEDNNVIDPITLVTDNVTVTVNVTDNVIIEKYKTVLMSAIEMADVPDQHKEYFVIAKSYFELIRDNMISLGIVPNDLMKSKALRWTSDIRLMITADHRTHEELQKVYKFLKTEIPDSNFSWKKNIRSSSSLRGHFEKLLVAASKIYVKAVKQSNMEALEATEEHLQNYLKSI